MKKRILVVRQSKTCCAAIAVCMVAFFTMASSPTASAGSPIPVTITGVYDFAGFPNVVGHFTTTGALTISGTTTMNIGPLGQIGPNGSTVAHCVVTLIPSDNSGTITIDQQCKFATSMPAPYPTGQGKGRWEIVGGTGAYANLFGNGSLTMPGND